MTTFTSVYYYLSRSLCHARA